MSESSLPFNDRVYPGKMDKNAQRTLLKAEWEKSIKNPQEYWAEKAKAIDWFKTWDKVLDDSNKPFYKWFAGGVLNISYNALDRHLNTPKKNMLAYIWEGEDGEVRTYSYYQLYREVNKLAKIFKDLGLKKGDRVSVYLPMIPELPITLLACSRIGAVHTVVFSGFSAEALADRINDSGAKVVVTADGAYRRGKTVTLKDTTDHALQITPNVQHVIVVRRTKQEVPMKEGRDVWYHEAMREVEPNAYVAPEPMESTEPLFILYTSGTTGKP
ncbi:MAG TPA: AMP-binding protein, partial [Patescibacteria group bacterium]|nr:AMP-binding protein [Patescibacteria group bacterium]